MKKNENKLYNDITWISKRSNSTTSDDYIINGNNKAGKLVLYISFSYFPWERNVKVTRKILPGLGLRPIIVISITTASWDMRFFTQATHYPLF